MILVAAVAAASVPGAVQDRGGGVFRGRADAVTLTVTVRDKERPVPDLTVNDFALADNGVPQGIASVTAELVPIDATLALDTSASVEGEALAGFKADVQRMAQVLTPSDRLRLITFASRVTDLFGLRPGHQVLPLERLMASGSTVLYNALAAALMVAPDTERAHLVFALTDGLATSGIIDPRRLVRLAEYSNAVLYVALVRPAGVPNIDTAEPGLVRWDVPHRAVLEEMVRAAGGRLYDVPHGESLPDLFARALRDFRQAYVLRYAPQGVSASGWHRIDVVVPARPHLVVRARKGYER